MFYLVGAQFFPKTFANDEGDDPSRVGAATDPLMEGMEELDTIIGFKDRGTGIARELQRVATRSRDSRSRNLLSAFRNISSWCDQFSLPKTISDMAKQLYKRVDEEKLLRGKPLDAVIATSIFIACRQAHVARTFCEICKLTNVPKNMLVQCYKVLEKAFNLTLGSSAARADDAMSITRPEDILVRFCNRLDLPPRVQTVCKDIVVAARGRGIADGCNPSLIVGGAIYFACLLLGVPKAIKEIAAQGVSEGTIRRMYRLYYTDRRKLVKNEWVKEGKVYMDRLPAP
ncbi:cyclin-like protein [Russula aff. rugulosa BPL654]|nr:cyclin-like protein [Russula aff. rugulosa BPL654]